MNRKLKTLGLALLATFALSALGTGAAHAEGEEFHSEAEDVVITDIEEGTSETHIFTPNEGAPAVSCNDLDVEGRNTGVGEGPYTTDEITLAIDYSECEFEGEAAVVDDDGCHYSIQSGTTGFSGHSDVKITGCDQHGGITFTTSFVDILVTEQTVSTGTRVTNTFLTIDLGFTLSKVDYHCTPAFFCEIGGIAPTGEGGLSGALELGAFEYFAGETGDYVDGQQVDVWHE